MSDPCLSVCSGDAISVCLHALLVRHHRPKSARFVIPNVCLWQGLGHTVAYCGDGINDIAALHAAELGIAIGATEAVVAAPVFTPAESASGRMLSCTASSHALHTLHQVMQSFRACSVSGHALHTLHQIMQSRACSVSGQRLPLAIHCIR